jgi:hypothetical protein
MKKIFLLSLCCFILISCSNSEDYSSFKVSEITSKWRLAEYLSFDPDGINAVPDNAVLEFKSDGTFTSYLNNNFPGGTYTVSNDSIISFNYATNTASNMEIVFQKIRIYTDTKRILDDDVSVSGTACAEGCAVRYEKMITP